MVTRSLTVRSKLALVFFMACALTFGVGGSFISRSVAGTLEAEILARLESQSWAYASALDGQLAMLLGRAEDFASDGFLRDAGERLLDARASLLVVGDGAQSAPPSNEIVALERSLRQHLLQNKQPLVAAFTNLQLVSMEGSCLLAMHAPPSASSLRWLAEQSGSEQPRCSGLIEPVSRDAQPELVLAAPLTSRDGQRRLGWLLASVSPGAWVFGALGSIQNGPSSIESERIHLLDGRGSRLTLMTGLFPEGLPGPESQAARNGIGLIFDADFEPAGQRSEVSRGEATLRRSFPLASAPWSLQVESKPDQELAAVAGLQGRIFGLGIVVAAAACLLFLLPMRILTRPLLQLAEAARRVGEGQDPGLLTTDSSDEIGEVGRSFVAMAEAVKERTRLQERTAEDLRQRQAELQSERDRLKAVIGSMGGGLIVLDPDGKPVVSNKAAEPILRVIQNGKLDIDPHHFCERSVSDDDSCRSCLFDSLRAPKACQVEIGERTYEIHASLLPPDADGRVGRVLVCMDFTDRVNLDERMIHQERLAVLGEVAAVMAHELNNPLAAISMYNQMLASELEGQPELQENVEVIQRNVASCKRAIRELLDYATGATPELDSIDLGAVLEDVAAFTRPLRERAEVELHIKVPKEPILAWGDELQVRQIFVNLLVNAFQVLAPTGGHVHIEACTEGNRAVITISDDGPGIPAAARADIFRPFFTTKARGEGTGLGLPTARRIAEMHGGGVELLKSDSEGSVFRVRLMQQEVLAV